MKARAVLACVISLVSPIMGTSALHAQAVYDPGGGVQQADMEEDKASLR